MYNKKCPYKRKKRPQQTGFAVAGAKEKGGRTIGENMEKEKQEERIRALAEEMKAGGLKEMYQEVIWDVIPQINEVNRRLSQECGRPVMDNITWRVKTPESIVNKLERKGREVSLACAMETLNDLAGIRVVCFFQDDVYRMAKAIRKIPGLRILKVKNYIAKPKASGYRSIHVIAQVLHHEEQIRVEIQVRSVAMNYWAILDHQLCYKNEKKDAARLKKELKACAVDIAEIDKRFLKLRKQIEKL